MDVLVTTDADAKSAQRADKLQGHQALVDAIAQGNPREQSCNNLSLGVGIATVPQMPKPLPRTFLNTPHAFATLQALGTGSLVDISAHVPDSMQHYLHAKPLFTTSSFLIDILADHRIPSGLKTASDILEGFIFTILLDTALNSAPEPYVELYKISHGAVHITCKRATLREQATFFELAVQLEPISVFSAPTSLQTPTL